MTLEDFGVVLRHGHRIDRLSAGSNDRFNEVLAVAEQKLREGDYFTAERRFEHALRFTPGHPLATAGLAHAQLGAGLFLSSSFTLRNLFINQPEMIDVQYSPDLLPNAQRMSEAITKLKTRLQGEKDLASYGMLLAYVGHQTGDQSLVEQGLNQLSQSDPGNALLPLLRSIWQDEVGENR